MFPANASFKRPLLKNQLTPTRFSGIIKKDEV